MLDSSARVGFTQAPAWCCYSPVKNNAADAAASVAAGVPAGSALQGESDQYFFWAELLRLAGAVVVQEPAVSFLGLTGSLGPRLVFHPSFVLFPGELKARFPNPQQIEITGRSTLIITGNVTIESLHLDGALKLEAKQGTHLVVRAGENWIRNLGHVVEAADKESVSEEIRMRGYIIRTIEINEQIASGGDSYVYDGMVLQPFVP